MKSSLHAPVHPGGPRGTGHNGQVELATWLRDQTQRARLDQHDEEL